MWDASFEDTPSGKAFGSVTCSAIQAIKSGFRERFSTQHSFDLTASPDCNHIPGLCSVVNVTTTPISLGVVGAMVFDTTGQILYRDNGTTLEEISTFSHAAMLNLVDPACHPQYVLRAGGTPSVIDVTVPVGHTIVGLNETEGTYSNEYVMPYGLHIGVSPSGGAKHNNGVITSFSDAGLKVSPYDKIKTTSASITQTLASGSSYQWLIGRYAFMPFTQLGSTTTPVRVLPLFDATPPDDWIAGFTYYNNPGLAVTIKLKAYMVAES